MHGPINLSHTCVYWNSNTVHGIMRQWHELLMPCCWSTVLRLVQDWALFGSVQSVLFGLNTPFLLSTELSFFRKQCSANLGGTIRYVNQQCSNKPNPWPHGLRRRSAAAPLLGWRIRIPPWAWMSVVSVVCCQVEVSESDWSLVQRCPIDCACHLLWSGATVNRSTYTEKLEEVRLTNKKERKQTKRLACGITVLSACICSCAHAFQPLHHLTDFYSTWHRRYAIGRHRNFVINITYSLTPSSTALLDKLTGFQLVKKFPAFYVTRRFITAFTSARHLSLSWATLIQSIHPRPTFWRSVLI